MPITDLLPWNREKEKYSLQRRENDSLLDMRNELNNIFEDFFDNPFSMAPMPRMQANDADFFPVMDVSETDKALTVTADLPGMDEKDIHLSIEGREFNISGTRQQENKQKDAHLHRIERSYGSFQRSFTLPFDVDSNSVEASFSKGVLRVTIPKPAQKANTVKRIPIKSN
jgi:HSP20 family protein